VDPFVAIRKHDSRGVIAASRVADVLATTMK